MADRDLPLRVLPILERWDCRGCGDCCKRHTVFLDADDLARLERQGWQTRADLRSTPVVVRQGWFGQPILNQRADGSCIFLQPDGLCRVHAEFGEPEKPWACRMYPFELIPFGNQVRATIRRNCPSAAANLGRPVAEHLSFVKQLIDKALPADRTAGPPAVTTGGVRSWKAAQWTAETFQRVLTDSNIPLVRRLVHALRVAAALAASRQAQSADESLKKLLPNIVEAARAELSAAFANRRPPSSQGSLLFRQTAAEYARFHPNVGDRPGWRERVGQLRSAIAFARGNGVVPAIHPDLPPATFPQLEMALGPLPLDVQQPLADYFETNVAAARYCGSAHFGWSIVDGIRGLALGHAAALWLLRWRSVGRAPTTADAIEVVRTIDRSHEYPLLGGARHRRRIHWLARSGDLEKIVVWQSR